MGQVASGARSVAGKAKWFEL